MIKLSEIINYLEEKFPKEYAEDFDNIGLLIGKSEKEVKGILISLDFSYEAVCEAKEKGANVIITHHPAIFNPIKEITDKTQLGKAIILAIENGISIYSVHTNLDSAPGGLTDLIASKLNLCAFENIEGNLGRICTAPEGETIKTLCAKIKKELGVSNLFSTAKCDRPIKTVALCNGGGGGELVDRVIGRCDVYISGDLKHHEHLAFSCAKTDFIEIRHFDSEVPVCKLLCNLLKEKFGKELICHISSSQNPIIDTDLIV